MRPCWPRWTRLHGRMGTEVSTLSLPERGTMRMTGQRAMAATLGLRPATRGMPRTAPRPAAHLSAAVAACRLRSPQQPPLESVPQPRTCALGMCAFEAAQVAVPRLMPGTGTLCCRLPQTRPAGLQPHPRARVTPTRRRLRLLIPPRPPTAAMEATRCRMHRPAHRTRWHRPRMVPLGLVRVAAAAASSSCATAGRKARFILLLASTIPRGLR
jgi:hypothetical protein